MGRIGQPLPVKLIVPMFSGDETLFQVAESQLRELFGPVDYRSGPLPFEHTSYYIPEFGLSLLRNFVAFRELIDPSSLADIKLSTNALERALAEEGNRRINLDPGYISQSKLVLATTKNHIHRIYLGRGIYAEVTLHYRNKAFRPSEWTYPDYRTEEYLAIFEEIRRVYIGQLRARTALHAGDRRPNETPCLHG